MKHYIICMCKKVGKTFGIRCPLCDYLILSIIIFNDLIIALKWKISQTRIKLIKFYDFMTIIRDEYVGFGWLEIFGFIA